MKKRYLFLISLVILGACIWHNSFISTSNTAKAEYASQATVEQSKTLLKSAVSKYNYKDYNSALNSLEELKKVNPGANIYDVLYPVFAVPLNKSQNAIKALDTVISEQIRPFRSGNSNYHIAYELRGSLKMLSRDYTGAISDFKIALNDSYSEYDNAYQGLILAYLMHGDIEPAKQEIMKYSKRNLYYQFADCTTYSDKIILNIGYNNKITYNMSKNSELADYMVNNSLSSYAYTVSKLYSDIWGGNYIDVDRMSYSTSNSAYSNSNSSSYETSPLNEKTMNNSYNSYNRPNETTNSYESKVNSVNNAVNQTKNTIMNVQSTVDSASQLINKFRF